MESRNETPTKSNGKCHSHFKNILKFLDLIITFNILFSFWRKFFGGGPYYLVQDSLMNKNLPCFSLRTSTSLGDSPGASFFLYQQLTELIRCICLRGNENTFGWRSQAQRGINDITNNTEAFL